MLYFFEDTEINKATIKINDGSIIEIWSNLPEIEVVHIIESLMY